MRYLLPVVFGLAIVAAPQRTAGGQESPATTPTLAYKLVDWPTPPTSAAGFLAAWNLIQAAGVAVSARGSVLVLHRGAHPVLEFNSDGAFVRSWGDGVISEGKVAAIPQDKWVADRSRYDAVYGPPACASCGAHAVRVDPQGNIWL